MSARSLTVLTGRAASGKSEYLFEKLRAHADRGECAILLTEEQSTYEAEKALCARYGGLLGTEVLSISRFCQRVLAENGTALPYLSPQGRCMVLKKIALRHKKELALFSRTAEKRGFAAEADSLINRLSKNAVSPAALRSTAHELPAGALKDKLNDVALLYEKTEQFLSDKYHTEYTLLERAESVLADSELAKSHIYIDSADLSGERAFRFLGALLDHCLSMTVTVLTDPDAPDETLFRPGRELYEKLFRLAADKGIPFSEAAQHGSNIADPALGHLERYLYREEVRAFSGKPETLTFNACPGRAEETELLCERIADLTEQGFRYRDIAVTVTDKKAYLPLIVRACRRRGIPLFEDAPRPLSSHAAADLLLSAVRFIAGGSMDDLLHIVKSGLTDITREEAEYFENYVLRYGLYGSAVYKPFTAGKVPEGAEAARGKLAGPLSELKEELSRENRSAAERVKAIYRYLSALGVSETLRNSAAALQQAGENGEAQLLSEVWTGLMEMLGQIYTILDQDTVALKDLPGLLEEGIFATMLAPLPGNQDRVTVGDIDRSRNPQRDVLFVLGANEGLLPPARTDDGLFSDAELNELAGHGLTLWENTEKEMARDRMAVYTVLTKARRKLYITYAAAVGGEANPPSSLRDKLEELFPALGDAETLTLPYPTYPDGAFEQTLRDLVLFESEKRESEQLAERVAYFSGHAPYDALLDARNTLGRMGSRTLSIGRKLAGDLYGRIDRVSPTRLEQFNKCPFSHYLMHGLRAEERKELKEEQSDMGTFLHEVLKRFLERAEALDPEFTSLTPEGACALIDEIVPEYIKEHNEGIYEQDPVLRAGLFLQTECARRCALAILNQIQSGDFLPYGTEYAFDEGSETPGLPIPMQDGDAMLLYGRIDRIDRSRSGRFIRIIDYKLSASKKFEPAQLEAGITLQLPLYLRAVRGLGGEIAGMYYMPLRLAPGKEDEETRTNKLRGVTLGTEEAVQATEHGLTDKSALIESLGRKKDGLSGNICEPEEFDALTDFSMRLAAETGRKIREGDIGIRPYEAGCAWCAYKTVCRFREETGYRKLKKGRKLKDLIADIEEGRL